MKKTSNKKRLSCIQVSSPVLEINLVALRWILSNLLIFLAVCGDQITVQSRLTAKNNGFPFLDILKSQIWKSETSPNLGTWLGIPWLGLVSLCQIWDFYGYSLNTQKYPKMGIRYFFLWLQLWSYQGTIYSVLRVATSFRPLQVLLITQRILLAVLDVLSTWALQDSLLLVTKPRSPNSEVSSRVLLLSLMSERRGIRFLVIRINLHFLTS